MLTLDLQQAPYWLDLPFGVRLNVVPLGTSILGEVFADLREDEAPEEGTEERADDDAEPNAPASRDLRRARAIASRSVLDWEGVGDERGDPIALSEAGLAALFEIYPIYVAFQQDYILPAFRASEEGNGSAPLPTGTSAGA